MSAVQMIDRLMSWAERTICPQVQLKQPVKELDVDEELKTASPAVFAFYVPAKDRLPPGVLQPFPSLCVQVVEGEDDLNESSTRLKVRFSLSVWNPGRQKGEMIVPAGQSDPVESYRRTLDGWRDVWNFADVVRRELKNAKELDGLRLVQEDGIRFGPYAENGSFTDFYPYWFAWMDFTVATGSPRRNDYEDYL